MVCSQCGFIGHNKRTCEYKVRSPKGQKEYYLSYKVFLFSPDRDDAIRKPTVREVKDFVRNRVITWFENVYKPLKVKIDGTYINVMFNSKREMDEYINDFGAELDVDEDLNYETKDHLYFGTLVKKLR